MESRAGQESRWIAGVEPPTEMLTRSMTSIYEMECREQPERLAHLLQAYREEKSIRGALEQLRTDSAFRRPGNVGWNGSFLLLLYCRFLFLTVVRQVGFRGRCQ